MFLFKCLIFLCLSLVCQSSLADWQFLPWSDKGTTERTPMHERLVADLDVDWFNIFATTKLPSSTTYEPTESTSNTEATSTIISSTVSSSIPDYTTTDPTTADSTTIFSSTTIDSTTTDSTTTDPTTTYSTTTDPTTTDSTTIFSSTTTDSTTTDSSTIFISTTTEHPSETSTSAVTQSFPGNGPRAINGSNSDSGSNDPTNGSETDYTTESASETPLRSNETSAFTVVLVDNNKTSTTESTVNPEDEDDTTNRDKYERNVASTTIWDPSLDLNKNSNSTMEYTTTEATTPIISVGSISETGEKQVKSSSFNSIGSNKFLINQLSLLITLYIFC